MPKLDNSLFKNFHALNPFTADSLVTINISSVLANVQNQITSFVNEFTKLTGTTEEILKGSKEWGKHGWCVVGHLPIWMIKDAPASLLDADKSAMHYMDKEWFERTISRVKDHIRNDEYNDLMTLYVNKQYRVLAMLLCSVIDRKLLLYSKTNVNCDKWLNSKSAIDSFNEEFTELDTKLIVNSGLQNSWKYFFKSGNNFNRSVEGEMNRNFLMHGMMYKPVRKKTCIKLICILDSIIYLLT